MKNFKKLLLLSLFFIFFACFNQVDDITIFKSGRIEMVTTIEITDKDTDKDKVKEEIKKKVALLKEEGWNVTYKWKKNSKPYKIKFTASNTLNNLYEYQKKTQGDTPSGVYIHKKFADNQYVLSFDLLKDANNRIVNLSSKSLSLYTVDDNDKLKEHRNIKSEKYYYVLLDK